MAANTKIQPGHPDDKGFAKIEMLLEATGGLSLSQVCAVTGLEGSTIQNWVKRGWVEHPVGKKYEEVHIARILIINALKECIKLEHISQLMMYVNGITRSGNKPIIKESTLYNYLCEALKQSAQSADHSKSGVEAVINNVIKDYSDPNPESRIRIRKALTLMMFACVCTDVKRRVEAMLGVILDELHAPVSAPEEDPFELRPKMDITPEVRNEVSVEVRNEPAPEPQPEVVFEPQPEVTFEPQPEVTFEPQPEEVQEEVSETRKTVSQALREWDISSVERIIIDHEEGSQNVDTESVDNINVEPKVESEEDNKQQNKPWYVRRNTK